MVGINLLRPGDMHQSIDLIEQHTKKLRELTREKKWPEANARLRLIDSEIRHSMHVAGALSLATFNEQQRFTRAANRPEQQS